ncbi:MAG: AAA family ATPase [Candidatus Theseobacter exili]|nr:AAA family ATPase [Candidatus Theseobacter exili]
MIREYDISDAAKLLNISKEATRKRIARKTIKAKKKKNRWVVYIDDKDAVQDSIQDEANTVVDVLKTQIEQQQGQIEYLRQENEQKNHIIMSMTNNIQLLSAPKVKKSIFKRIFKSDKKEVIE